MADMPSGEFKAIYKKARRAARQPRPIVVNPVPKLQDGGSVKKGTIQIRSQRGLGLGSVLLGIGAFVAIVLAINGFELSWLNFQIPSSIRMTQTAPAAADSQTWYAMLEAEEAGDDVTLSRLRQEGRVFTLAEGRNVRLAGIGLTGIRVRALEGRDAGRTGWVPFSAIGVW